MVKDPKLNTFSDAFDSFKNNLNNFELVSEKVENIQTEIQSLIKKEDLDRALMSQLLIVESSISEVQNKVKSVNKETLFEIRSEVSELTNVVENLLEVEFPKYKKQLTKNQFNIGEKFESLKEIVESNIGNIKEELDNKLENVAEVIDENLEYFNQKIENTSSEVKRTSDTFNKLSKIVESRISKENEKLEEYSETIKSLYEAFVELQNSLQYENLAQVQTIEDNFESICSDIETQINSIDGKIKDTINLVNEEVSNIKDKVSSDISVIKADVVINEQHLKKVETYIQENYKQIINLREEVFEEIERIPVGDVQENIERLEKKIDFICETYSKIEPEVVVKEVIKEGLLNIPPDEKTSDPLSPLDNNFVTLEQLQEHYRLFINRVQQQLASIGGGGEYRFRFLDGIVGIKTNPDAYDGKFLQWNSTTQKAEFVNINAVPTENIVLITGITTYYQATNGNDYIGVSANVPVLIDLPQEPIVGKRITVKDEGNKISTYNITVNSGIGVSVENSDSVVMKVNHESFTFFYNGQDWYLI